MTSWQTIVRQRLEERDGRERGFDEMVENYQRLTKFAKQQKERNTSILTAAGATSKSSSTSNSSMTGTVKAASEITSSSGGALRSTNEADSAAVKQAYITSLESQLQSMRDELATLYKTQSQNAQRLLDLNEQIQSRSERDREQGEESRKVNEEVVRLRRKEEDLRGVVGEKDKMIQMLQDEISALSLELNQVELRNDDLKRDNASLLQRWLDRMNDEAEKMNDGNQFLQEVDKRRAAGKGGPEKDDLDTTPTSAIDKGKGIAS